MSSFFSMAKCKAVFPSFFWILQSTPNSSSLFILDKIIFATIDSLIYSYIELFVFQGKQIL